MVSAILSRASSYLINPNNFATSGYIAATAYLMINTYKVHKNKLKDKTIIYTPLGFAHILSFISQANLSLLALIMSKNKVSTYISSKLGSRFLPSARTMILAPLALKTVNLLLHMAQEFNLIQSKENISEAQKKICVANFCMCTAYLAAFALTAFSQFESWKEAIGGGVLLGVLLTPLTYQLLEPVNDFFEKRVDKNLAFPITFLIITNIPLVISLFESQFFKNLSSITKSLTILTIIVYNVASVFLKAYDLLSD